MKKKQSPTRTILEIILDSWNKNCEAFGNDEQFKLEYNKVKETIKVEDKEGTIEVGRVTIHLMKVEREPSTFESVMNDETKENDLIEVKGKVIDIKQTLLFKRDFPVRKISQGKEEYWQECLSRELLYEMLGTFCMTTRGMALERIKIQGQKDLMDEISSKIKKEENSIINKPVEEQTEEDKVFIMMNKAKNKKVSKIGIVDKNGNEYLSETDTSIN